jgi:hypothetical protein
MERDNMQSQWEIKRASAKAWQLWSRSRIDGGSFSSWQKLGTYGTRKAAVQTGMILRDRGEPIAWPGGPIRMGIALVESCKLEA